MNQSLNWVQLVKQNRVKALGVPWTNEEQALINAWKADNSKGFHPDDIRSGKYLEKQVEEPEKEKPTHYLTKEELLEKARELKLDVDETIVQRSDLIVLINQVKKNEK